MSIPLGNMTGSAHTKSNSSLGNGKPSRKFAWTQLTREAKCDDPTCCRSGCSGTKSSPTKWQCYIPRQCQKTERFWTQKPRTLHSFAASSIQVPVPHPRSNLTIWWWWITTRLFIRRRRTYTFVGSSLSNTCHVRLPQSCWHHLVSQTSLYWNNMSSPGLYSNINSQIDYASLITSWIRHLLLRVRMMSFSFPAHSPYSHSTTTTLALVHELRFSRSKRQLEFFQDCPIQRGEVWPSFLLALVFSWWSARDRTTWKLARRCMYRVCAPLGQWFLEGMSRWQWERLSRSQWGRRLCGFWVRFRWCSIEGIGSQRVWVVHSGRLCSDRVPTLFAYTHWRCILLPSSPFVFLPFFPTCQRRRRSVITPPISIDSSINICTDTLMSSHEFTEQWASLLGRIP